MNIKEIQEAAQKNIDKLKAHYDLNGRELTLAMNAKLSEECGELSEQILGYFELQRKDKLHKYSEEELAGEVFDVVFTAVELAQVNGINLTPVFEEKIKKILGRDLGGKN